MSEICMHVTAVHHDEAQILKGAGVTALISLHPA
jgi:hypothetical protein